MSVRDVDMRRAHGRYEIDAVALLLREYEQSLPEQLRHTEPEPEITYFLAARYAVPSGCIGVMRIDPSTAAVRHLYVRPGFRGRGIARSLLSAAVGFARERGFRRVVLNTERALLPAAYALYRNFGFTECGPYEPIHYPNATFMELPIASEPPSLRVALGRYADRARYDFPAIAAILDEALICHVGFVRGDHPVVIPTAYGRIEKMLYFHGSALAHWMKESTGANVCVTVSILDALVLARSAYQHSFNYRSVVAFGNAQPVEERREKLAALRAIVEHVCRGRWSDVRAPSAAELNATLVLRVPLTEASAKIRTGNVQDFDKDMARRTWAGVLPLQQVRSAPIPDAALPVGVVLPPYLR